MKEKVTIAINPPPSDRRCECCNKHISEVKPFGGPRDPLVGDFTGQLLVKNFRALTYHIEEYDNILNELIEQCRAVDSYEDFEKMLIERVGEDKAQTLLAYDQLINTVGASWECRDCFILNGKEFFEKRK